MAVEWSVSQSDRLSICNNLNPKTLPGQQLVIVQTVIGIFLVSIYSGGLAITAIAAVIVELRQVTNPTKTNSDDHEDKSDDRDDKINIPTGYDAVQTSGTLWGNRHKHFAKIKFSNTYIKKQKNHIYE